MIRCVLLVAALLPTAAWAQQPDTLRTMLPEITVQSTAPRAAAVRTDAVQPTEILTRADLDATGALDVAGALRQVPGVTVRSYGGLGGLKTLSVRGTGPAQTVLLIDGVRYEDYQTGTADLGTLPLDGLESITVVRGGAAAQFGADALGGAVELTPSRPTGPFGGQISADIGSFADRRVAARAGGGIGGGWSGRLGGSYRRATGDYLFSRDDGAGPRRDRRRNSDLRRVNLDAGLSGRFGERTTARLTVLGGSGERGVPGPAVTGRADSPARQWDADLFAVARLTRQLGRGATLDGWTKARFGRLRYLDPTSPLSPTGSDTRTRTADGLLATRLNLVRGPALVTLGGEIGRAVVSGDNLALPGADPAAPTLVRSVGRTFGSGDGAISATLGRFSLETALRIDGASDVTGPQLSPAAGVNLRLGRGFGARLHAARSFRLPSFSERYTLNFGAAVRPERGRSLDLGLVYSDRSGRFSATLDGYGLWVRDRIVATPSGTTPFFTARNIGYAVSRGGEASVRYDGRAGGLRLGYTRLRATDQSPGSPTKNKQLVYQPEEIVSALAFGRLGPATVSAAFSRLSHRFFVADNPADGFLPAYHTLDLTADWRHRFGFTRAALTLTVENALDADYDVIRDYPMPGRSVRLGVSLGFNTTAEARP